ncbi:MAG: FixH family protein [Rickettsiales bacterium]|nr:FixH family protein [Rickettsiales bacterium]
MSQKKSKIPYLFFIFFAVVFTVDAYFIYISKKTWRGVTKENSYQAGVNYNQTLAEEKKQQDLGWKVAASFNNLGKREGVLLINLQDKNSQIIKDAEISVELKRPVQEGLDFSVNPKFEGGIYEVKINFEFKGQWDFFITVKKGNDVYKVTKRFVIYD